MKKGYLSFALLVALVGLGAGCFRLGPRVVKNPVQTQKQVAVQQEDPRTADETGGENVEPGYSADAVIGYLELGVDASVDITRDGSKQAGKDGTELVDGDEMQVGRGVAFIIYPDSGRARLDEGTDLVLLKDEAADGNIFIQLRLNAGRVWTRFERLLGQDEYYSVSANGVVATVRGTAFGVEVQDDGVDIQVADHEVEVSNETAELAGVEASDAEPVKITSGEGLKIATKGILLRDARILKSTIRRLSVSERLVDGFKFGITKLTSDKLKRPVKPVILPARPVLRQEFMIYRELLQRRREMLINTSSTFVVPERAPLLQEILPSTQPQVIGPGA